jgi:hypothetical protein
MLSAFTRNVSSPLSKFSLKYRRVRGALSSAGEDATRDEIYFTEGRTSATFSGIPLAVADS